MISTDSEQKCVYHSDASKKKKGNDNIHKVYFATKINKNKKRERTLLLP